MTKKEIIERCIAAYSEAIEVCKGLELDEAKEWLDKKSLIGGVCSFVAKSLNNDILFCLWVERNETIYPGYWANPPYSCMTHPELIESLTTRLDILKRELEIPE